MLSSTASQNITYHCSGSAAYYSESRSTHKAAKLMTWNDLEIGHRGKFSYEVPTDECKVSH
jgi:hypothetical protein